MENNIKKLAILVPIYEESTNVEEFLINIDNIRDLLEANISLCPIFLIDPDKNNVSLNFLNYLDQKGFRISYILFSRRFGQPTAIFAGLREVEADAYIVMDVDGQDPVSLVPKLVDKFFEGYEIVLPRRQKRLGEKKSRVIITKLGYWLLNVSTEIRIPKYVGDFRLISKKVRDQIVIQNDFIFFLRGLTAYVGFDVAFIDFIRPRRSSGRSKYNKYFGSVNMYFRISLYYLNNKFYFTMILIILTTMLAFLVTFSKLVRENFVLFTVLWTLLLIFFSSQFYLLRQILLNQRTVQSYIIHKKIL